ncbi:MAG: DUF4430 domain-containing protein [Cellulosilyticaceae bacterium]
MNNLNILVALAALVLVKKDTYRKEEEPVEIEHIVFSVYGPGGKVEIFPETKTRIKDDETVLSVTERMLKEKGMPYEVGGTENKRYIKSINGLAQGDKGPQSGWLYKVNSEFPDEYASQYELENGDCLAWLFTTNLGKDVGAPMQRTTNTRK